MATEKANTEGVVTEVLPNSEARVELADGKVVRGYLCGKMKQNHIRVIIGDKVEVFVPDHSSVARITRRKR